MAAAFIMDDGVRAVTSHWGGWGRCSCGRGIPLGVRGGRGDPGMGARGPLPPLTPPPTPVHLGERMTAHAPWERRAARTRPLLDVCATNRAQPLPAARLGGLCSSAQRWLAERWLDPRSGGTTQDQSVLVGHRRACGCLLIPVPTVATYISVVNSLRFVEVGCGGSAIRNAKEDDPAYHSDQGSGWENRDDGLDSIYLQYAESTLVEGNGGLWLVDATGLFIHVDVRLCPWTPWEHAPVGMLCLPSPAGGQKGMAPRGIGPILRAVDRFLVHTVHMYRTRSRVSRRPQEGDPSMAHECLPEPSLGRVGS